MVLYVAFFFCSHNSWEFYLLNESKYNNMIEDGDKMSN